MPAALLISMTPIAREARLQRQATALRDKGWKVFTAGHACDQPMPEGVDFIELVPVQPDLGPSQEWWLRSCRRLSRWKPSLAERYYWDFLGNDVAFEQLAFVEGVSPDIVIGHEYFSAPLAARVAKHHDAAFSLDIHEYAIEQYAHDSEWLRTWKPYVAAIERLYLPQADPVSTICEGISDALVALYGLKARPIVARSVSYYREMPFRPAGETIEILYHGLVSPLRGLETAIESVKLWRPEFRLKIRGMPDPGYAEKLSALARDHGVADRVTIAPGVDLKDLVPLANESDVGFFVQEDVSLHKHHTLPNKLFEYIMAGLGVVVSDLPEMRRVVNEFGVGRLVSELSPQAVATAINGLTREDVDLLKRRALEAARTLCWEVEAKLLLAAYEAAVRARRSIAAGLEPGSFGTA